MKSDFLHYDWFLILKMWNSLYLEELDSDTFSYNEFMNKFVYCPAMGKLQCKNNIEDF